MKNNLIKEKSFQFALAIIQQSRSLAEEKREFVMSKQLVRSGTAIGALIREAEQAESRADFIHKLSISLKEANETEYWIELLHKSDFLDNLTFDKLRQQIGELNRLLIAIIRSSKQNTYAKSRYAQRE